MNKSLISYHAVILLFASLFMYSCGTKKHLSEGTYYYEGSTIKFEEGSEKLAGRAEVMTELNGLIYPEPNKKLFGIARTKVWFYNLVEEPKKDKGFKHWVKYKLGKAPVLLSETDPDRIQKLMTNRLYNHGHFTARVNYDVKLGNKEGTVKYKIDIDKGYKIDSVAFPEERSEVLDNIRQTKAKSLLKPGDYYSLDVIKLERQRISEELRSIGFYFFEPDFLLFEVDSTLGNNKVNIFLELKKNVSQKYLEVYKLGDIYVDPDFDLRDQGDSTRHDTIDVNGYHYLMQDSSFRPEVIIDAIYIEEGQNFSSYGHDYTINRLIGLGAFQFVNVRYSLDENNPKTLKTVIQLTPYIKKSIRLELSATTKSNGFTGPGFQTTFKNRNALRGAELLTVNLTTGYETQISSSSQGLNSYELGVEVELDVPRFVLPFGWNGSLERFTPQTNYRIAYRTLNRLQYFRINSIESSFGYKWRETHSKYHELYPINLNYTQLANSEPAFEEILDENPLIRRSFEEQFIVGSIYSYTYDGRLERDEENKNNFYFKGTIDLSGNLAQALTASSKGEKFGDETNYDLLGIRFSQYLRLETSFKYYIKFDKENVLANRLIMGLGLPNGNSTVLPYIKQFFIGGGNSVRAFQARTLGPGTYRRTEEDANGNIFIDQSGDIKLEFNTEYRFPVYGIFKGAVFVDAGNIWLLNEDTLRPGGQFETGKFMNQLGVGSGFGLRIDPDFFVIRFDIGFPMRKPFLPEGERWVLDEFGKDPVLNIAIGYPF